MAAIEPLLTEIEISRLTGRAVPTLQKARLRGEGPPSSSLGVLCDISHRPCRSGWIKTPANQPRRRRATLASGHLRVDSRAVASRPASAEADLAAFSECKSNVAPSSEGRAGP